MSILLKIVILKSGARQVNAGLYVAFKHRIFFETNLAANFGCDQFRIMPEIVSKLFLHSQLEVKSLCCSIEI